MKEQRKGTGSKRAKVPSLGTQKSGVAKQLGLDEIDVRILQTVQEDCRTPLESIARELGIPKSILHYRIHRLEQTGVIEHYFAKVNATKFGKDYLVVVLVRAKYGPHYYERIGKRIAAIPGI